MTSDPRNNGLLNALMGLIEAQERERVLLRGFGRFLLSSYIYDYRGRPLGVFTLGIYAETIAEAALIFRGECMKQHRTIEKCCIQYCAYPKFYCYEFGVKSGNDAGIWYNYDDLSGIKKCSKCDERKLSRAFPSRGLICRDCVNLDRREKNRDETRRAINSEKARQYRNNNRVRALLYGAKSRARVNGLPFDLEPSDIVIPDLCPVFGTPMRWDGRDDDKPSLDRLKPSLGYVKGNVHIISLRANRIKNDGRSTELAAIAEWMKQAS